MKLLKTLLTLFFLLMFFGAIAGLGGWVWLRGEFEREGPLAAETMITIERGEPLSRIAERLQQDGIVSDARLVRVKARLDGVEGSLRSGEYAIPPGASVAEVLRILTEGRALLYRLTIPEGRTSAQILRLVEADPVLEGDLPDMPGEGTLLPDTYVFPRGTSRAEIIDRMREAQEAVLAELWEARQKDLPLQTPYEAVILASIVEKEAGSVDELPDVAALFTNRMRRGIRLQSDPTIIYGVTRGERLRDAEGNPRGIRRSEIDTPTDWNTYQIDGLPKTPITNPGRPAIAAVLDPPQSEYIFMVAKCENATRLPGHHFSRTLDEHNRRVAAFRVCDNARRARERQGR
jgi:UPF0755 protein